MKGLTWTPIRKGELYCSDACGCGCRWLEYTHAHDEGATMAAEALEATKKVWDVHVWENGGWNWSIKRGVFAIHGHEPTLGPRYYTGFLNLPRHQIVSKGDTVAETYRDAMYQWFHESLDMQKEVLKILL